jgi:hypothetical protein
MKLIKINLLAALVLAAAFTFTGCTKDDGAIPNRIKIEEVPVITTNLETGGTTATIANTNQAAFQGKFKVALFFPDQTPPTKVDVMVRKNGAITNVKLYKADVTALPASFTVTAAEIAALFGTTTLALNDTYDFAPDIYVNDKKYQAWPAVGTGTGAGVTGMSSIGFGEYVRFSVK